MNKYLPSLQMVTQEAIATGLALILFALVVAHSPTLKALVKNYDLPN